MTTHKRYYYYQCVLMSPHGGGGTPVWNAQMCVLGGPFMKDAVLKGSSADLTPIYPYYDVILCCNVSFKKVIHNLSPFNTLVSPYSLC